MADFVLVIPRNRQRTMRVVTPPFVFLQLAAALENEKFTSVLIDARVEKDFLYKIEQETKNKPLFIGITSMTGIQTFEGVKIAKFIKGRNKKIPVVWGGCHATFCPEQLLNNKCADVAVIGEGESTVVSLAREYKSHNCIINEIRGIAVKENGRIVKTESNNFLDLDSLPMPAWHLIKDKMKYYLSGNGLISIMTSRGCPHNCFFCYNANMHKRMFRARSAQKVLEEIDFLHNQLGITRVSFCDDNFLTNRNRIIKICNGLKEKGHVTPVHCDVRADYINDELLAFLANNGFKSFYLGIEHGSQKMLDLLNKGMKVEMIKNAITLLNQHTAGGHTYSFMIGLPEETKEDIVEAWSMMRWISNVDPRGSIDLNIYTPYPGTELINMLIKKGYKIPDNLSKWNKYHWNSTRGKGWIKNKRLVRSLLAIFRLTFTYLNNKLTRFLSHYARKVFLAGEFRPYLKFEFLYFLFREF